MIASELVAISADRLVAIPDPIDDPVAAGLSVTYGTAMHGLVDRAKLGAGETLLVLGAAGGAGLAAVEIGAKLGARVIAAASSGDKLAVAAEHGASAGIDYATESLRGRSNDLTGGGGVDVVYDCVGGAHAEPAFRSIAWGGRYLVVGFASGAIPKLPLNLPLLKGASIVGVYWGEFLQRQPASQRRNLESVIGWVASGAIKPKVHASYPLARFRDAFAAIENRQAIGKVILTP